MAPVVLNMVLLLKGVDIRPIKTPRGSLSKRPCDGNA